MEESALVEEKALRLIDHMYANMDPEAQVLVKWSRARDNIKRYAY